MEKIKIAITGRVASVVALPEVVADNAEYEVDFALDPREGWDVSLPITALFVRRDGSYTPRIMDAGATSCTMPPQTETNIVFVGLTQDDLRTTTPATIKVRRSIRTLANDPLPAPTEDVYAQILAAYAGIKILSSKGAPTSATQGAVNQLYRDEDTQRLYICTATDGGYTWAAVSGGSVDVDDTLTKAGYAADAKAAGDAIGGKIDAPQVAQVGEVLTVEEVDAEGKPKKWKTAPGANITTELTRESTDAQVPSAKAAYDAIEQKIDKNQGVESAGMILGVDEDGNVVPQNKPAQAIAGAAAPTTATAGVVGQEYYVITDGVVAEMYVCTAAANGTYAWNKVELGAEIDDTSTEQTKVWSAKKSNQLSQDVAKLKEKKAEIDDTAVGANAWSSQNIVDMLCPPIQESGNPVVCYPVAVYPLGVKAKWEPVQEGSGTPSPENIRPIKGRDSVTVERCGENLSTTAGMDNVRWATSYTDLLNALNRLLPGTYVLDLTFTLEGFLSVYTSDTAEADSFRILSRFANGDECVNVGATKITKAAKLPLTKRITKTFVVSPQNKGRVVSAYFYACGRNIATEGAPNGALGYGKVSNVSITPGTTAPTTYTPYIGTTNTLTLPETVYGGEVDAVSGSAMRTWEYLTLTADMGWHYDTANKVISGILPQDDWAVHANGKCSHLNYLYDFTIGPILVAYRAVTLGRNETKKWTIETWKAYLAAQYAAGTPVQVCYKLAEPAPFTATGAQPLPALAGVNTVLTDADAVEVTGRADPIKRITDLEDAVASQT